MKWNQHVLYKPFWQKSEAKKMFYLIWFY
jgi:hypothetical protein